MGNIKVNSIVRLKSNHKEAKVAAINADGTLTLHLESITLICPAEEVEPTKISNRDKAKARRQSESLKRSRSERLEGRAHDIDLHGLRVDEAIHQLEKTINYVILEDIDHLVIIHGVGSGRVMEAVHKYLKGLSVVKHFKMDDRNPGQTHVYF